MEEPGEGAQSQPNSATQEIQNTEQENEDKKGTVMKLCLSGNLPCMFWIKLLMINHVVVHLLQMESLRQH